MRLPPPTSWIVLIVLCCAASFGCRRGAVIPVSVAELTRHSETAGGDLRARRSVTTVDGRTAEVTGRIDVELRPHRGPRRVYRHPVVIARDGDDLIVHGSNRPPARIRADEISAVVLHVQQSAPEPSSSGADQAIARLDCARSESEIDALEGNTFAVRGCERALVVRCQQSTPSGDARLQIQTGLECRVLASASWRVLVRPWRVLDDAATPEEIPGASEAVPSTEPGPRVDERGDVAGETAEPSAASDAF